MEKDFRLIAAMEKVSQTNQLDNLAKYVVFIAETEGKSVELLKRFVSSEVVHAEDENTLFSKYIPSIYRSIDSHIYLTYRYIILSTGLNSFSTKLFKTYSRMVGLSYLWNVLASHIIQLQSEPEEEGVSMEVDPNKVEEGADHVANKWQLLLTTQKIFTSIIRSSDALPT